MNDEDAPPVVIPQADPPSPAKPLVSIYETMAIRNVAVVSEGRFVCEVEHPVYGWSPFTADADDPEVSARRIYERIVAGELNV